MKDHTELKKKSYSPKMSGSQRAKADRKRLKGIKSPDMSKKIHSYHDPKQRLWIYSDRKNVADTMKRDLIPPIQEVKIEEEKICPDTCKIIELYKTKGINQIAKEIHRSQKFISKVLHENGVKIRGNNDHINLY